MPERTIEARIDINANPKTVTLTGLQPGLNAAKKETFNVLKGDTLKWELLDKSGNPTALPVQVRFEDPSDGGAPLFKDSKIFKAGPGATSITSEKVSPAARAIKFGESFEYRYHVELEGPPGRFTDLLCFWGDDPIPTGMGGGTKSGGPRGG